MSADPGRDMMASAGEPTAGQSASASAQPDGKNRLDLRVEFGREEDGRWIAEVVDLPGVLVYGSSQENAFARVKALALHVIAERIEHGELSPSILAVVFRAATAA